MRAKVFKLSGWLLSLWVLLNVSLSPVWANQEPVLKLHVDPHELNLGETLNLTLTLRQQASARYGLIEPPNLALPPLDGFLLRSQQSESQTMTDNQGIGLLVTARYVLEPVRAGELTIPSFTLTYRLQGQSYEVQTQAVNVRVNHGTFGSSLTSSVFSFLWAVGGALALLIVLILFWRLRRRQNSGGAKTVSGHTSSLYPAQAAGPEFVEEPSAPPLREPTASEQRVAGASSAGPQFEGLTDAEASDKLADYLLARYAQHWNVPQTSLEEIRQHELGDLEAERLLSDFLERFSRYKYAHQALNAQERQLFLERLEKILSK